MRKDARGKTIDSDGCVGVADLRAVVGRGLGCVGCVREGLLEDNEGLPTGGECQRIPLM
jgi:hypothetical protein